MGLSSGLKKNTWVSTKVKEEHEFSIWDIWRTKLICTVMGDGRSENEVGGDGCGCGGGGGKEWV